MPFSLTPYVGARLQANPWAYSVSQTKKYEVGSYGSLLTEDWT